MKIEELKNELKKYLQQERYAHSISVMEVSEKLAEHYKIDKERIMKTALMHDLAKEMSISELKEYVLKNNIYVSEIEMVTGVTLHAKVAADICKKKYEFDDEMCNAISAHTTGKANMSLFEKIIFIADKIDYTREYEGVEELRELAFSNINEAVIRNIENTTIRNKKNGRPILEESIKTRNYILMKKNKL